MLCDSCAYVMGQVLIDTWWNVNADRRKQKIKRNIVLIDTWWNVNILPLCVSSNVSVGSMSRFSTS